MSWLRQLKHASSSFSQAPATWIILIGNMAAIVALSVALFGPVDPDHKAIVFQLAPSFRLTRIKSETPADGPTVLFGLNGFCQRHSYKEDWDCQKQLNMRQPFENRNVYNVTHRPFHVATPPPSAFPTMVYISWGMMWLYAPLACCSRFGYEAARKSRGFHKWILMWGFVAASMGLQGYLAMYLWWNKVQDDINAFILRWVALDISNKTSRGLPGEFNVIATVGDAFVVAWIGYGLFIGAVGVCAATMPRPKPVLNAGAYFPVAVSALQLILLTEELEADLWVRSIKARNAIWDLQNM